MEKIDIDVPLGVDLKKLKEKFEEEKKRAEERNGETDSRFVRLPDGKTVVRILPPYRKDKVEFFEHFLNHRIGGKNIVCLREKKYTPVSSCPLCKLVKTLYQSNSDADISFASSIRAREKFYYNVVVREYLPDNPEKAKKDGIDLTVNPTQVKILSTGIKLYNKIKQYIFETEYGDITDVYKGYDFVIVKEQVKIASGLVIPNYDNSYPKKDSTPLAEDAETIKEILTNMYDLRKIVESAKLTYDRMIEYLERYFEQIGNEDLIRILHTVSARKTSTSFYTPSKEISTNNIETEETVKLEELENRKWDNNISTGNEKEETVKETENKNEEKDMSLDEFEKELLSDFEDEE